MQLTIFFDGQYCIGLVESDGFYLRYIFGKEPNGETVLSFVNHVLPDMLQKQEVENVPTSLPKRKNPKQMQRLLANAKKKPAESTQSQLFLAQQRDAKKQQRQQKSRLEKERMKQEKFALKQEKKKQKHKGH